jgi:hypothetical protein
MRESERDLVKRIVEVLRESARYNVEDLRNLLVGETPRVVDMTIWRAREVMRMEHGVDFGPVRGFPGEFERKMPSEIASRAERQRAKGSRAHRRAAERFMLAADGSGVTDAERTRYTHAAERIRLREAMARTRKV